MSKKENIIKANKIINRMKNLKEVQIITGENPIICRLTDREIKEIIDLMTEYVYIRERLTGNISEE